MRGWKRARGKTDDARKTRNEMIFGRPMRCDTLRCPKKDGETEPQTEKARETEETEETRSTRDQSRGVLDWSPASG